MSDEHELARDWSFMAPHCRSVDPVVLAALADRMAAELNRLKAENDAAQDLQMRLYGIIGEMTIKLEQIGKILGNPGQDPKG